MKLYTDEQSDADKHKKITVYCHFLSPSLL